MQRKKQILTSIFSKSIEKRLKIFRSLWGVSKNMDVKHWKRWIGSIKTEQAIIMQK